MCSINHDLKAIYLHIPKTGGSYISSILTKYYGFKNYYLKRPDHNNFCLINDNSVDKHENKIYGTYLYYKTSKYLNKIMNMNDFKWSNYKIFTFIRDPIERLISGFQYCRKNNYYTNINFEIFYQNSMKLNCWTYWHCFMPQIRHIVDENNKNVCFFIGNQKNMEYDLNKILNIFNLKAIHKPFKKNSSKNKINPLYDEAILKKIFHDDYERLFN